MRPIFSWLGSGDIEPFHRVFPNAGHEKAQLRNDSGFSAIKAANQCFYTKLYLFSEDRKSVV